MSTYPAYVKQALTTDINLLRKVVADLIPLLESCNTLARSDKLEEAYSLILDSISKIKEFNNSI